MVKQINAVNNYNNYPISSTSQVDFGAANIPEQPNDSFVSTTKSENSSQKSNFALIEGATAALAVIGFALFAREKLHTTKLGKAINETLSEVGELAIKSIKESIEKLSEIGTKDALSGMYNRRSFDAALKKTFDEAVSGKKEVHAAILDMDFFKSINEVLGHEKGDEFIKHLGKNISEVTEKHKVKGYRYGGEEFAILMPGHNAESSKKIIQEIADKIKTDDAIQKYKEEFLKKANEKLQEFRPAQEKFDNFWNRLKDGNNPNQKELATETLALLGENPQMADKGLQGQLDKAVEEIKKIAKGESNEKVLNVVTNKYENNEGKGVVAIALNQKHNRKEEIAARLRWISHVQNNNGFTISGGISKNLPDDDMHKFFKRADINLAKAKDKGRNTIIAD